MSKLGYSWLLDVVARDVDRADAGGRKLPAHIEHFDVEDGPYGRGVIVTLAWGWSFEPWGHQGVRGFDTITEARRASARKRVYPCGCDECRANVRQGMKEEVDG